MSENSGEIDQGNLQKKVNTYTRRAVLGVGGGGKGEAKNFVCAERLNCQKGHNRGVNSA